MFSFSSKPRQIKQKQPVSVVLCCAVGFPRAHGGGGGAFRLFICVGAVLRAQSVSPFNLFAGVHVCAVAARTRFPVMEGMGRVETNLLSHGAHWTRVGQTRPKQTEATSRVCNCAARNIRGKHTPGLCSDRDVCRCGAGWSVHHDLAADCQGLLQLVRDDFRRQVDHNRHPPYTGSFCVCARFATLTTLRTFSAATF